jgi:hypothetical protein
VIFGSVPVNKKATLSVVSFMDNQAYFYKSSITAGSTEKPKIALKPADKALLNQQLSLLK